MGNKIELKDQGLFGNFMLEIAFYRKSLTDNRVTCDIMTWLLMESWIHIRPFSWSWVVLFREREEVAEAVRFIHELQFKDCKTLLPVNGCFVFCARFCDFDEINLEMGEMKWWKQRRYSSHLPIPELWVGGGLHAAWEFLQNVRMHLTAIASFVETSLLSLSFIRIVTSNEVCIIKFLAVDVRACVISSSYQVRIPGCFFYPGINNHGNEDLISLWPDRKSSLSFVITARSLGSLISWI